jgi:hypothetical protein
MIFSIGGRQRAIGAIKGTWRAVQFYFIFVCNHPFFNKKRMIADEYEEDKATKRAKIF